MLQSFKQAWHTLFNQTWHTTHAINAGTACDLSTAGCPVDQFLDLTAPTGATLSQSINQSINQSIQIKSNQLKSNQIKSNQDRRKYFVCV